MILYTNLNINNMPKLKEYKVGLFYEVSGYSWIKAKSQERANEIGLKKLTDIGEETIQDVTHRDFYNV